MIISLNTSYCSERTPTDLLKCVYYDEFHMGILVFLLSREQSM